MPALPGSSCEPFDIAESVETDLAPRDRRKPDHLREQLSVTLVGEQTVTELRSALTHLGSDERDLWIKIGMALRELGETGRGLWLDWSQTSEKYDPRDAAKTWDSFKPHSTSYKVVFSEAQRMGWVNPSSNAAAPPTTRKTLAVLKRELVGRSLANIIMRAIDWLWEGWIPIGYLTIFAGETGAGKSTILGDVAARVSTGEPWPGESNDQRRLPGRVLWLGSEDSTEEMTVPRLTACGADLANIVEITGASVGAAWPQAKLPDGIALFRCYDPRVLTGYFSTASPQEVEPWYRGVSQYSVEDADDNQRPYRLD